MNDWKSILKSDPTPWLLEDDNPSVRYYTLKDILDEPESSKAVKQAKAAIMTSRPVVKIFDQQRPEGCWDEPHRFYIAKYRGTVWQLIILAELGVEGADERIQRACEFILKHSQDPQSGGFAEKRSEKTGGGLHSEVLPCLTGNLVWSLLKFGLFSDPRVQRGIDWMTTYQRFDDAETKAPKGWPYDRFQSCWGKHTCHMGVVKMLKALSAIPPQKRSAPVNQSLARGAEFMLIHHIHKQSHNLKKTSKPGWKKLGFPLMYPTDILEILQILLSLGHRDDRMQEAIDLVIEKQDEQGRWILENTFNGRMITSIEQKGKPSKWITLGALRVLKAWGVPFGVPPSGGLRRATQ